MSKVVEFGDLYVGEKFIDVENTDKTYMVISDVVLTDSYDPFEGFDYANAINIETGEYDFFACSDKVIKTELPNRVVGADKPELIGQIVDVFEDFLEDRDIQMGEAIIYGDDYDRISMEVAGILNGYGFLEKEE